MIRPATASLRQARGFSKLVTVVVLAAFVSLTLQPLALAANLPAAPKATSQATATTDPSAQLAQTLEATEAKLGELIDDFTAGRDPNPRLQDVKQLHQQLKTLDQAALQSFTEVETHLKAKALPQAILDRHTDAVKSYTKDFQTLTNALTALEATPDNPGKKQHAEAAFNHLKEKQKKRAHTPVDPNNLPFRTPDGKVRPPHETPQAFRASLFKPEPIQVASTELTAGMLSSEMLSVAAVAAAPTPADLAPTEDVQITPEIQALATTLNNNPVKIYNWVRNNIKFLPTYGSIQGSQMALETKQGNAFDTASLLIALLRASGIHSRYVYGTVQIPVDKVMNWVGGVTAPEAAQQLLGQGGIPNIGLIQGGKITHIKMEHMWVEAWVDFEPSRGAIHKQGDTWVPMDASFKQYQYTQGMDIKTNVPFDAAAFVDQLKVGATINETEGWVKNINNTQIQTTLTNYQNQVKAYIETTKPNATVGDILGTQIITSKNQSVLAASLPYQRIATGSKFAGIPDNLRYQFQFNLYATAVDRILDSPILNLRESLPKLAGKKITLAYEPATSADQILIDSLLANNALGLPGYLIRLKAAIRIDGQVIARGGTFTLGEELISTMGLSGPMVGQWGVVENRPIAGEVAAVGIDTAGISQSQLISVRQELTDIAARITEQPSSVVDRDQLLGGLLHGTLLTYFGVLDGLDSVAQKQAQMVSYRLPSFGTYTATLNVTYSFGLPRIVYDGGLVIDIDHNVNVVDHKNNVGDKRRDYVLFLGTQGSAMEHYVPELVFSTDQTFEQGVSAVKLLTLASQQGMKVFRVTSANANSILPLLSIDAAVKSEIADATMTGKEVTVSQSNLTVGSWSGVGYAIIDPVTGSGAYKINGGANGGFLKALSWLVKGYVANVAAAAHLLGGDEIARVVSRWGALVGFVIGLIDIAAQCAGNADGFRGVVLSYTLAVLVGIVITGILLPLFLGFWWVLVAGLFLTYVVGLLKDWLIVGLGCRVSSMLRNRQNSFA